jgi:hypothetical protein
VDPRCLVPIPRDRPGTYHEGDRAPYPAGNLRIGQQRRRGKTVGERRQTQTSSGGGQQEKNAHRCRGCHESFCEASLHSLTTLRTLGQCCRSVDSHAIWRNKVAWDTGLVGALLSMLTTCTTSVAMMPVPLVRVMACYGSRGSTIMNLKLVDNQTYLSKMYV